MKKIIKCLFLLLISTFLFSFLKTEPVSANYDSKKNYVRIETGTIGEEDTKKLKLKISITYQRGFDRDTAQYMICKNDADYPIRVPADCGDNVVIPLTKITADTGALISYDDASKADSKTTTKSYEVVIHDTSKVPLNGTNSENSYVIFVQTFFCAVRSRNTEGKYDGCQIWHTVDEQDDGELLQFTKTEFKVDDVRNINLGSTGNKDMDDTLTKISRIVYDTVMPIIWVVLGLFMLIKGSLLGVQIVKAADEPQIRQEKIGSLKWLVIGCAITAAASGLVTVITGFFSNAFNFN